jgi:hypothetical protein
VDAEVVGGEEREAVGAEAVEGDVAEVEQPGPADRDVQPEREQHEEERVDRDLHQVARVDEEGQERDRQGQEPELDVRRDPVEPRPQLRLPARLLAPGDAVDPLVDADARPVGGVRALRDVRAAHTLLTVAFPKSPLGRRIITAIRIEKTIRSLNVFEM